MRLIIAEKPSVAQAIADVIGAGVRASGYIDIRSKATVVTWCYGHLLEQAKPESYVEGGKVLPADLPVIPTKFVLMPREQASAQVNTIKTLLRQASEVVNAGDADREGQLLVDELFPFLGWRGKTLRLWLSSLDVDSVKRALLSMKPNEAMRPLYESALARQRADWIVSLNASIALSRNLQGHGVAGAWSIGRVQTPTLALIVDRQTQIQAFIPRDHYSVQADLGEFVAAWDVPDDLLTDGLLLEKHPADKVAAGVAGAKAIVQKFTSTHGTRAAPMPFTLGSLQKAASAKLGLSANDTLAAAQALYEAKLSTYPRSDCPYLPEELFTQAPKLLTLFRVRENLPDPLLKHAAWNTSRVEAHHGIIPTGNDPEGMKLDVKAEQVFALIRVSYLRLFYPAEQFVKREARFGTGVDGRDFTAKARVVMRQGWTQLGTNEDEDDAQAITRLPVLVEGQALNILSARVVAKRTTPAKNYTDGTLIAAMMSVHKLVTDPSLRARLKETSGLGTEATRAGMIETLVERTYIERNGKDLIATERGIKLVGWLRLNTATAGLTDPGTTALQEDGLADIATGKVSFATYLDKAVESSYSLCASLLGGNYIDEATLPLSHCPACGGSRCLATVSKASARYHRCLDCQAAFGDSAGKPGKQFEERKEGDSKPAASGPKCPSCRKPTFPNQTSTSKPYFRCAGCKAAWWPDRQNEKKLGGKWAPR